MKINEGEIIGVGSTLRTLKKIGETEKAWIIGFFGSDKEGKLRQYDTIYFPKSQVKFENSIFDIPDWLIKKNSIRDYAEVIEQCAKLRPEWLDDILQNIYAVIDDNER